MNTQVSSCCKARIDLTGSLNRKDGFKCSRCGRIVGTPIKTKVLKKQEGGDHYKKMKIQPIEYIFANDLTFAEGNIVKYATRHKDKNGAEDIKKIIHYAEFILEFIYKQDGKETNTRGSTNSKRSNVPSTKRVLD